VVTTTVPVVTRNHRRDGDGDGGAVAGGCDGVQRATSPSRGRRRVPACTGRPATGRRGNRRHP